MRLFVAISFDELKEELSKVRDSLDESLVKINKVNTFHLTMKFLGDIEDDKVDVIKEKLKQIKFDKFSLTLDKIGVFPSESYIKVVWVGVEPKGKIMELQKKVEEELKEFNFKKDFEFHPHITLARVKFVKEKEKFVKSLKELKAEKKTIEVKDFRLVKSTLAPEGPVYEDVEVFQ